ncbi:MAG: Co/Zn/Cd resistance protein CzcA [Candidatus Scalindua rubra]|uniref:Co/Zn/Cd resistance protein CzcA n=1 Tax=Candidatus Scalindua rubra TaxID=1872076 RepID=A0A1E3X5D5_9BACT|nr:MAG: Co/Zn/Cd resistance protein CzcA [Candidatus Scalindua rubra]
MINRLLKFCLENTFIVLVITVLVIGSGYYCIKNIPVDAIPDISENQSIVFTDWPGRDPQTVEDQVTYPLTISLEGVPGVKVIRSYSGFGFSVIYVIFQDKIDFYWARSRVLERLNVAQRWLPDGVVPVLGPDATALGQIFWYTIENGYYCPNHSGGVFVCPDDFSIAFDKAGKCPEHKHELVFKRTFSEPGMCPLGDASLVKSDYNLGDLRSLQDWYVRYQLNAVDGVSEVASVGGFVRQYQIDVDPNKMRAHKVKLSDVYAAVRRSNIDVGAKVIENYGMEYIIRGVGFIKTIEDVENIVVKAKEGTPLFIKNVATITFGPDFRRGALDKEGAEVAGAVVTMRYGENPLRVIKNVKDKIKEVEPGLPDGVHIVPFYDRTQLIHETIDTLKEALTEEVIITIIIITIFLLHIRSSIVVALTLPLAIIISFIAMYRLGVDSNVMSLSGIAIAIGTLVDMGIIMTENIYRHLTESDDSKPRLEVIYEAGKEVGGAIITAVSTTIVSFIPVFFMESQEGKLFKPLAYTKTFALFASVLVAITVVPVLCNLFLKEVNWRRRTSVILGGSFGICLIFIIRYLIFGRYETISTPIAWISSAAGGLLIGLIIYAMSRERLKPMQQNFISRGICIVYEPTLRWILAHKVLFLIIPAFIVFSGISIWLGLDRMASPVEKGLSYVKLDLSKLKPWVALKHKFPGIGREFMPALDEGSFLYMPSFLPAASLTEVMAGLKKQDILMKQIPEVDMVVGKLGRAETALDPAPVAMIETIINMKPKSEWRKVSVERWYSDWYIPQWVKSVLGLMWPEERTITKNEILEELRRVTDMPGAAPTWLQPIQTRVIMLQSGLRAMMGAKIFGADLKEIERIGLQLESIIKQVPGAVDVIADRIVGKPYIEYKINREAIARYGVNLKDVQDVIEVAIGGRNITWTVEGRERYPVRARYMREIRDNFEMLPKILVPTPTGAQIPITQVCDIEYTIGPAMIKSEDTLLVGYVTFNTRERDEVSVVEDADKLVKAKIASGELKLPKGYYIKWAGQFENQIRANRRMAILLPICLFVNFFILYLQFRTISTTLFVYIAIPVSLAGGFILLNVFGYNLSVAVWVGFIALFGIAVDNGVITATYLEQTFRKRKISSIDDARQATVLACLKRIRPCLMTVATTVIALMPVLLSTGRGSDVMKPMAIPTVGGMTVALITIFIVPCCYCGLMELKLRWGIKDPRFEENASA